MIDYRGVPVSDLTEIIVCGVLIVFGIRLVLAKRRGLGRAAIIAGGLMLAVVVCRGLEAKGGDGMETVKLMREWCAVVAAATQALVFAGMTRKLLSTLR